MEYCIRKNTFGNGSVLYEAFVKKNNAMISLDEIGIENYHFTVRFGTRDEANEAIEKHWKRYQSDMIVERETEYITK